MTNQKTLLIKHFSTNRTNSLIQIKLDKTIKTILAALAVIAASFVKGQEAAPAEFHNPPTNTEVLVGSRGVSSQMITDKKIKSIPQLGFFSVVDLNSDWGQLNLDDHMIMAKATVDIVKGLNSERDFIPHRLQESVRLRH